MSAMFASPPKPPKPPPFVPPNNTALNAQIAQANRRMGAAGTMFTSQRPDTVSRAGAVTGANSLTGA